MAHPARRTLLAVAVALGAWYALSPSPPEPAPPASSPPTKRQPAVVTPAPASSAPATRSVPVPPRPRPRETIPTAVRAPAAMPNVLPAGPASIDQVLDREQDAVQSCLSIMEATGLDTEGMTLVGQFDPTDDGEASAVRHLTLRDIDDRPVDAGFSACFYHFLRDYRFAAPDGEASVPFFRPLSAAE